MKRSLITALLVGSIGAGLALHGCGSSSQPSASSTQVSGVVSPRGATTVTLSDSSVPARQVGAPVASDGSYSVEASGLTAPFTLVASGGTTEPLSAVASGPGVANINAMTTAAHSSHGGSGEGPGSYRGTLRQLRTVLGPLLDCYRVHGRGGDDDDHDGDDGDDRDDGGRGRDGRGHGSSGHGDDGDEDGGKVDFLALLNDVDFSLSGGVLTLTNKATGLIIFQAPLNDLASGLPLTNLPAACTPTPTPSPTPTPTPSPTPTPTPTPTPSPTPTPTPSPTPTPTPSPTPSPTPTPTPTPSPTPTPTPSPTPTPTPSPTPTPTPTPPPINGAALYTSNCAACHGPIGGPAGFAGNVAGFSAGQIQNAINGNVGGMGSASLRALTPAQVTAIAAANP